MGNHVVLGHAVNCCQDGAAYIGCSHDSLKFESTAKAVMNLHSIESWNAKSLVKENLRRQGELAAKSPLRNINVQDGLAFIKDKLKQEQGVFGRGLEIFTCQQSVHISREQFVDVCWDMLHEVKDYRQNRIKVTPKDREELYDIFDSMDFDRSGVLSTGEWAGGCSVFFRGSTEECVKAVFNILDQDSSATLTQSELREYLKPFLKAMMPEAAQALQPMLLKRSTEKIFEEMDKDHSHTIAADEMLKWTQEGHNIIDALAELIDKEVYALWMQNNKENARRNYNSLGANQFGQNGANGNTNGNMNGPCGSMNNGMGQTNGNMNGPCGSMNNGMGQMNNMGGPMMNNMGGPMNNMGGQYGGSPANSMGGGSPMMGGGGQYGGPQQFASGFSGGPGPCGSQGGQGGWGSPGGGQGGGGSPYGSYNAQQYGGQGDGSSPTTARGSAEHFSSTASHWSNVPPPPPPPSRGAPRQDTSGAVGSSFAGQQSQQQQWAGSGGAMGSSQQYQSSAPYGAGGSSAAYDGGGYGYGR